MRDDDIDRRIDAETGDGGDDGAVASVHAKSTRIARD